MVMMVVVMVMPRMQNPTQRTRNHVMMMVMMVVVMVLGGLNAILDHRRGALSQVVGFEHGNRIGHWL